MGGRMFAAGPNPLHTPRMPPAIYAHAKEICHHALGKIFDSVATPIEGPGKQDYGDIDILVHGRREPAPGSLASPILKALDDDLPLAVCHLLRAERMTLAGPYPSYAIPWPKPLFDGHISPGEENDKKAFIQVDVQFCQDPQAFKWSLFHEDHGDVWNLLGAIVRPCGLTVTNDGLYVRIPEIEKENRTKARILLTHEPAEALEFLGLDYNTWKQPFASMDEAYEYVATSRFFWVKPYATPSEANEHERTLGVDAEFKKQELKSNDRQRMTKRPMFRRFIDEFIPQCRREGRFAEQRINREQTLLEAFERFGVRQKYENQLLDHRKQRQVESLWKTVIKAALPEDGIDCQRRGVAARALKKIIMQDDKSFGILPAKPLKDSDGLYLEDEVRSFVQLRWEEIGEVAWRQHQMKRHHSQGSQDVGRTACGSENGTAGDEAVKLITEDGIPNKKCQTPKGAVGMDGIGGMGSNITSGHHGQAR